MTVKQGEIRKILLTKYRIVRLNSEVIMEGLYLIVFDCYDIVRSFINYLGLIVEKKKNLVLNY